MWKPSRLNRIAKNQEGLNSVNDFLLQLFFSLLFTLSSKLSDFEKTNNKCGSVFDEMVLVIEFLKYVYESENFDLKLWN